MTNSAEEFIEKTEVKETFKARQMRTFEYLGTTPDMWEMCDINDIIIAGGIQKLIFSIPTGFKMVEPYYEIDGSRDDGYCTYNCQLCGHPIENLFPIFCTAKQIYMHVGSECVLSFKKAGYITKKIKIFKESKTREKFLSTVKDLIDQINAQANKNGRLPYDLWKFKSKLIDANNKIEQYGKRKINNLLNKAEELGLIVGRTAQEIETFKAELEQKEELERQQEKTILKSLIEKLKPKNLFPMEIRFTQKFLEIAIVKVTEDNKKELIYGEDNGEPNNEYALRVDQVELLKSLGGFYWNTVKAWVIPNPTL